LTLLLAALPHQVQAQQSLAQQVPNFGMPVLSPNQGAPPPADNSPVGDSFVSIIDSAVPINTLRLRFDAAYHIPRPTRAEFFQAKGGVPFSPGMPLPEPNINSYQELNTYLEFAPLPFLSLFLESPVRWINPAVNSNTYGYGDINFGFKLCSWNSEDFLATLQLRFYDPTAQRPGLGTHHWTIEPALLGMWRPYDNIILEGDLRYWAPLGETDFAGDVLRYGVGISLGQKTQSFWIKPVAEAVGWSVLGGKSFVVNTPDSFFVQDAAGQTIINGYLGVRFGAGYRFDCYAGYGRCLTGSTWWRDFWRVEVRWFY
jgi:hypothetical protein